MLYVLDEPSAGLHQADLPRLVDAIKGLRDRGNSVAVVEHEPGGAAGLDPRVLPEAAQVMPNGCAVAS